MRNLRLVLLALAVLALVPLGVWTWRQSRETPPPAVDGSPPETVADYAPYYLDIMGTTLQVLVPAGESAEQDAEAVFDRFREVDARMSEWKDTSPLSAVNREAGLQPVAVPDDLRAVVRRGIEIGDLTGGAFDISWAALWGLWDFKAAAPVLPDAKETARRTALVDYLRVEVDDEAGTVFLPESGMKMGLGGIAKGYALDRAAADLRERGVTSFLILGGGQVMAGGRRGDRPWKVGIRDPRGAPSNFFATLELTDASTSTSGDYERFFILDGKRYHHILDPRTGMPSVGLMGVTVVSGDATLADALSTAIMVMGQDEGLALAERLQDVEAVLIDLAGEVFTTSGLASKLQIAHPPRVSSP